MGLEQKVLGGNPPLDLNDAQGGPSHPSSPPSGYATLEDDGRA